jgi:hypothetical protein
MDRIDATRYQQMCGRAGRAGTVLSSDAYGVKNDCYGFMSNGYGVRRYAVSVDVRECRAGGHGDGTGKSHGIGDVDGNGDGVIVIDCDHYCDGDCNCACDCEVILKTKANNVSLTRSFLDTHCSYMLY